MKNLFLSFFSLFLCFCYFNIFAQNADNQSDTKGLYMNVYAFPNYHYYEFSEPNIFGSSIHYGGNIGFNLNEKWSFETGLMYYETKREMPHFDNIGTFETKTSFYEIPLQANYDFFEKTLFLGKTNFNNRIYALANMSFVFAKADYSERKEQNFTGFHYFYNTLGLGFATEVNKTLGIFVEPSIKISPTSITGFAVSELTYNGALGARVGVKYNF